MVVFDIVTTGWIFDISLLHKPDVQNKWDDKTHTQREKCRKERVGPVAANPDNLESNKGAGGGSTRYSGLK